MDIFEKDLTPEEAQAIRESIDSWKEETTLYLEEEANRKLETKIEELESANIEYREQLKEEMADKFISALDEFRDEIRAEVIAEMVKSNPEIKILESVKELVAPTLSKEYFENVYAQDLIALKEENDKLKEHIALDEGAKTLADLVQPYSEKTRNMIISLVKPGDSESVTEQFYNIIENLEAIYEETDDEEDEEEVEDEEGDEEDEEGKDKKKKKKEKKDDKDEDDEEEGEEEGEETDESVSEGVTDKGLMGLDEDTKPEPKRNLERERILGLAKSSKK